MERRARLRHRGADRRTGRHPPNSKPATIMWCDLCHRDIRLESTATADFAALPRPDFGLCEADTGFVRWHRHIRRERSTALIARIAECFERPRSASRTTSSPLRGKSLTPDLTHSNQGHPSDQGPTDESAKWSTSIIQIVGVSSWSKMSTISPVEHTSPLPNPHPRAGEGVDSGAISRPGALRLGPDETGDSAATFTPYRSHKKTGPRCRGPV